jgi:hypothetical protein
VGKLKSESEKFERTPQSKYILSPYKLTIAILYTYTDAFYLPFYWTIPETNSTQYPLIPLVDLYNGF